MNKKIYILTAMFVLVFCGVKTVSAQEDIGRLLQELENNTDRFSKSFDNALDNSELNGTSTEGEATRYVQQFEDSIDRLKNVFDERKETKIAAREALDRAKVIDGVMRKYKMDTTAQTDWKSVKTNIYRLAKAHNIKVKW